MGAVSVPASQLYRYSTCLNTFHREHPIRSVPHWFVSESQKCLHGRVTSAISAGDEPQRFSQIMSVGVDVNTGLCASCVVMVWTCASTRRPSVALASPWPVCVCLGGTVTCVRTHGGPGLWASLEDAWLGIHCPMEGGCSPSAGWTGRRCRALVSEGRLVAGLAALWARVRHPQSPWSGRPFQTPAMCRPGGRALGLQPRRGNGGEEAQDGPGKASEGGSGRVARGARVLQPAPSSGKRVAGLAFRAGLRVCACAPMCARACVPGSWP